MLWLCLDGYNEAPYNPNKKVSCFFFVAKLHKSFANITQIIKQSEKRWGYNVSHLIIVCWEDNYETITKIVKTIYLSKHQYKFYFKEELRVDSLQIEHEKLTIP